MYVFTAMAKIKLVLRTYYCTASVCRSIVILGVTGQAHAEGSCVGGHERKARLIDYFWHPTLQLSLSYTEVILGLLPVRCDLVSS